jgi:hypothetical protein
MLVSLEKDGRENVGVTYIPVVANAAIVLYIIQTMTPASVDQFAMEH